MSEQYLGLEGKDTEKISQALNELLANYQVFYTNVRGFHWNVKGDQFFELHVKFEELYDDLAAKIDEIAERILTLGHSPEYNFSAYLKSSEIKESSKTLTAKDMVNNISTGLKLLIAKEREILNLTDALNDEGSNALMSDYISGQEKLVWMYQAYLS